MTTRKRVDIEITLPVAHSDCAYAVRQLLGPDSEALIRRRLSVLLTEEQLERLAHLTVQDLRALRDGPNGCGIASVRVYDAHPHTADAVVLRRDGGDPPDDSPGVCSECGVLLTDACRLLCDDCAAPSPGYVSRIAE